MSHVFATRLKLVPARRAREASDRKSAYGLPVILLLVFSALIAADRFVMPHVPINVDPASYAVVSHELLSGEALYTDIWDHKPPAIFVAYAFAELAFGYSPQTLVILNILVSLIALFGIYYAGKAGRGGVSTGLIAAALWAIVSGSFQLEGRDPNTEPFINACLIWAFALLAVTSEAGLKTRNGIIIGLLFVAATFFKPVVVVVAVLLVAAHVIFATDRKKALRDAVLIGSVGAISWLALFGYFAATGRFAVFSSAMFAYNGHYSGDMWGNLTATLTGAEEFMPDFMSVLAIFGLFGVAAAFFYNRRQSALVAAFIGASWIAIALPGRFSVHYYQLWLPPFIIGASWAIGFVANSKLPRVRFLSYAAAVLFLVLIVNQIAPYRAVLAAKWTPVMAVLNADEDTANRINSLLRPDETFFVWGNTPTLYLLTGRRPPTAVLFQMHLDDSPVYDRLSERVKADLDRERPALLVTENSRPPVPDWIAKDYEATAFYEDKDTYSFYARREGRLAENNGASTIQNNGISN